VAVQIFLRFQGKKAWGQNTELPLPGTETYNAGIPVKIDAQHAIAHNKVMIID